MTRSRLAARLGVGLAGATALAALGIGPLAFLPPTAATRPAAAAVEFPSEADHCYVEGMLMHHAQALELSESVLAAADVSERVRALAAFIVSDQTREMDAMGAWSQAWADASGQAAASGHASHTAAVSAPTSTGCGRDVHAEMSGMATPEQLAALAASEGVEAQRLFLDLMIVHHEGALVMAERAILDGSNAFVRSSAKHVIIEQQKEIAAMTAILAETA